MASCRAPSVLDLVSPLLGVARFQSSCLRGTSCPRAGIGLLVVALVPDMACCMAVVVLRLMPAHWWVRSGLGASAGLLVGGAES